MIRKVRLEDIDEIMMIERASFPVAWEYSIFLNICLHGGQMATDESKAVFMDVLEEDGKVIGYAVWETDIRESRGHLLNLAVQVDERRRGKGTILLSTVVDKLRATNIRTCSLEVRESNVAARALYESTGFIVSTRIPGYYFDEDAIEYSLEL
ncbi:MAG: ribosomal protein S18-alanine N-acetyltransferase [Promethearchaeota archaeon]